MKTSTKRSLAVLAFAALALAGPARAQELCPCPPPPPPEPAWKGSLGAGLSTSSGNTSSKSYNVSFGAVYDPKTKNVFKADGIYLRQQTDGETTTDKTAAGLRDEYKLGSHAFAFGDLRYLRDPFKGVRYVVSPVAGLGYKLVDQPRALLSLDAGVGAQFEGLEGLAGTTSGAVQAGQALSAKLSASTTLTQRATALWKMDDFGDALYRVEAALMVSLSKRLELKVADYFDYKTRPPSAGLKKNDNSVVAAIVFKIG